MTAAIDTMDRSAEPISGVETDASGGPSADPSDLQETSASEDAERVEASSESMKFLYEPGSQPLPRYTIRRGLGVGGFGEVYFAVSDAGKEVALKRIQRNLDVELRGVSHCLNLKHPNLVALYDICRDDSDQAWVVMEYVSGKNLRETLDQNPTGLSEPEARRWFSELCAGVDHLHRAGLVHRDLKPGNIFNDLGVVKVGDYGLSKFISASHRGGHTESVGTFHYMAPEIGRGEYGREIDIYALGVILFELLTGRVPFDGESCHEIIVKHMTALPDLAGVAEPYRSVIASALQKDPSQRPRSVSQLLQPLGLTTRSDAIGAKPIQPVASEPILTASLVDGGASKGAAGSPASPEPQPTPDPLGRPASPSLAPTTALNEEPLARAVRDGFHGLTNWWGSLERSPGAKTALLVVGLVTLAINTHFILPLLWVIGIFYVPYYIIRNMVLHVRQQPTYAEAQRVAEAYPRPSKAQSRQQWRSQMRHALRAKHTLTRMSELGTSSTVAILVTLFMALIAGVVGLREGPVGPMEVAPYGLMAVISMIASLPLLLMGKLWERGEGESLRRRIALAGLGAGVGVAAFSVTQHLMIPMDSGMHRVIDASGLPQALYADGGVPRGSAYMAHFALLFAGIRWWKMVDPLRRRRLSLWSVAVAVVGEWLVHQILPVPQPTGMLLAGGIAIAVQMSSPWVNPDEEQNQARLPNATPGESPAAVAGGVKIGATEGALG